VLKNLAIKTISRSLQADLLPWRLLRTMRSGTIVLGYHGIARDEEISDPWVQRSQTPLSHFKQHLEFIGKNFEVVSADESLETHNGKSRIHLTFDDGHSGFAHHAAPLLQNYGFPASVYVVTDTLTNNHRLPPYLGRAALAHCEPGRISLDSIGLETEISDRESRLSAYALISAVLKTGLPLDTSNLIQELIALVPHDHWTEIHRKYSTDALMGWDTLRYLSQTGFTVGAHTKSHLSLSNVQSNEAIQAEVGGSIKAVRHEIGSCDWFAYPNGTAADWSIAAAETVKKAGAVGAWTLEPGVIRDPGEHNQFKLPRFFVPRSQDRFTFLLNTALIKS
jgi:peptidoglycan/xylan/chitin deacetylase (PgdA/CDA1 family)